MFYMTDVLGISPGRAGTILLVCKIWDAIIDPWIGIRSDKLQHPMGRRRPFFMYASVPFAVLFGFLWTMPAAVAAHPGLYITFIYLAYTAAASLIQIPYNSLSAQLTQDYDERTEMTGYRMAFSIGAGILFSVVPIEIVQAFEDPGRGFSVMGWLVAAVMILSPIAMVLYLKEEQSSPSDRQMGFFEGLKLVARNQPFWSALVMFLFSWMALDVLAGMLIYYIKYWLDKESWSSAYMGTVFVTAAVFLPIWSRLARRIGKKPAYLIGSGIMVVSLLTLFFLASDAHVPALILCFIVGIGVSAIHILPWAIIPDVIEYDEMKSGERREGLYSGFASLMRQISTSGALYMIGILLESSGYTANVDQTPETLMMIRVIIGPLAAGMYLISMLAIWFYPIDSDFHKRMNLILEKKRKRHDPADPHSQIQG